MEWKPAHVADSKLSSSQHGGSSLNRSTVAYTFGHGIVPGTMKSPAQDDAAAVWWAGQPRPTTNDARNSDLETFWAGDGLGQAVAEVTGQKIRHAVKEAGRGSHIQLGQPDTAVAPASSYKDTFCRTEVPAGAPGSPSGTTSVTRVKSDMYFEAKQQRSANKALGTGSSVNLSFMW